MCDCLIVVFMYMYAVSLVNADLYTVNILYNIPVPCAQ